MENYRIEVRQFYEMKKAAGELSVNLTYPSPAKLRNECLIQFRKKKHHRDDDSTLKSFFGLLPTEEFHEMAIKRFDIDKFKPLCSLLKKEFRTDEKNIELLAWLIDFCPRPCAKYWRESLKKTQATANVVTEPTTVEKTQQESWLPMPRVNRPPLSKLYVGERKTMGRMERKLYRLSNYHRSKQIQEELFNEPEIMGNRLMTSPSSILATSAVENKSKQVTLEYPSGVKLSVNAHDISLIAQLVKL
ncbi:hypothetical protein [Parapedobacter koreensis]|uniref:Uncharacterized protein n=1 Tax=Parapedobacter koreensis TaxID=332977 RepID=A0A1H7FM20_9SPHI|nr:hypothetical protein [Parapedobacter koreensis]SEK24385.1 hypothetical protein SAMN05421740_101323 [Parapedobacter koreensis]